ncbi:MAG: tRNA dihydrouridine synthase DusB [Lachnospiraceae bacterium]|nr:tRNA dihydrouridine synthase DusB [Lachnospiraceae bacterium]
MAASPIHPIDIGDVHLENNMVLAPMAGVNDLPFRLLSRKYGAGLVVTEMVSAKAITYHNRNTVDLLETEEAERPVSVQLFGSEEASMEEAAAYVSTLPFDIVDINMGCPVPKIVKNGDGSALMREPEKAGRIAAAVVKGVAGRHPVTVKIRAGWGQNEKNAVEVAKALEAAGVSALAVHGRTREEFYSGHADWSVIADVKKAVKIPVFGNGDICGGADALAMYEETACDGFLIGRAARGNPWIFQNIEKYCKAYPGGVSKHPQILRGMDSENPQTLPDFDSENPYGKPSPEEVAETVIWHARKLAEVKDEYIAVREMRKQAGFYTAGTRDSAALRRAINECESLDALEALLKQWTAR